MEWEDDEKVDVSPLQCGSLGSAFGHRRESRLASAYSQLGHDAAVKGTK